MDKGFFFEKIYKKIFQNYYAKKRFLPNFYHFSIRKQENLYHERKSK